MGKEEYKTIHHQAAISAEFMRDLTSKKRTVTLKVFSFV